MEKNDVDIVQIIIENMITETELQDRIKFYMETHKGNCNDFIYKQYAREVIFLNSLIKSIRADLGAEITRTFISKNMV